MKRPLVKENIEFSSPVHTPPGMHFLSVHSPSLRGRGDVVVWLPPGAESLKHLPMVVLLHGACGGAWSWAFQGGAHLVAQRLINGKDLPPVGLVMPEDGAIDVASGYIPVPERDCEAWIVDDVPLAMQMAFPCFTAKSPRFMAGLSMGGFGALRLGAKYAERYRALSGHSSVVDLERLFEISADPAERFGNPTGERWSALHWLKQNREKLPHFRFDCGTDDHLIASNRGLHAALESENIPHTYEEFPGAHTWPYWTEHLADSLRFFARFL